MLPLGFVLFAVAETNSTATAGVLAAAFTAASALAPLRGRIVDRHGPRALAAFALACTAGLLALVLAAALGAPAPALVLIGGLAGLVLPPLGPFTRAIWGWTLRERAERLQRAYALDSAGEEAAQIVAPALVAALVVLASPRAVVAVAAAGMLAGTVAAARSPLAKGPPRVAAGAAKPAPRLPPALWLVFASLVPTAAALGALDLAVPAAAREQASPAAAGVLLSVMAVGTAAGSLLAGRRNWRSAPAHRVIGWQVLMALGVAGAALAANSLEWLALALILPGAVLGALFATLYVLVDQLSPEGSGTRTFAWLVTANNGGLAAGAAIGGALSQSMSPSAGLWFGALCALAGVVPATFAALMSAREPERTQISVPARVPSGRRRIRSRQGNSGSRGDGS
jgi:MFS family permease